MVYTTPTCIICLEQLSLDGRCKCFMNTWYSSKDIDNFMEEFHKSWSYEWHTDNRTCAEQAIKDFLLSKNLFNDE